MSDSEILGLLRQATFSFVGTIEQLGGATMTSIPIDDRTAVVRVDSVLHAPPAFAGLAGQRITLQLAAGKDLPKPGDTATFFAEGLAFGESIAVTEVGRLPVASVESRVHAAMAAGQPRPFAALEDELQTEHLREHAAGADAIVLGRVARLERAGAPERSEHAPDWWKATLDVYHVEKGDVPAGELAILYANSLDVRWRTAPKPKASQGGLWLLHATQGDLHALAPYSILHPEDFQPTQNLDELRGNGG